MPRERVTTARRNGTAPGAVALKDARGSDRGGSKKRREPSALFSDVALVDIVPGDVLKTPGERLNNASRIQLSLRSPLSHGRPLCVDRELSRRRRRVFFRPAHNARNGRRVCRRRANKTPLPSTPLDKSKQDPFHRRGSRGVARRRPPAHPFLVCVLYALHLFSSLFQSSPRSTYWPVNRWKCR